MSYTTFICWAIGSILVVAILFSLMVWSYWKTTDKCLKEEDLT
jgi:hypothetical protein